MSDVTLLSASYSSQILERRSTTVAARAGSDGVSARAATSTEAIGRVSLSRSTTSLDGAAVGAVLNSVKTANAAGVLPNGPAAALGHVLNDIGTTAAQGQGAVYIGLSTPNGVREETVTPDQLAAQLSAAGPRVDALAKNLAADGTVSGTPGGSTVATLHGAAQDANGTPKVNLTAVYVPPSATTTADVQKTQAKVSQRSVAFNVTA